MPPVLNFTQQGGGGSGNGGVSGLTTADGGNAIGDNEVIRGDGTTGIQGSGVTLDDAGRFNNLITSDFVRADASGVPKAALHRGVGTITLGLALAGDRGIAFSSGSSSESGFDVEIDRVAASILGLTDGSTGGGGLQLKEMTAPAGLANTVRIWAQDNGSGKTQLMVQFGTGAAIQIAIEP